MLTKKSREGGNIDSILSTYYQPLSTEKIYIGQLSTYDQKLAKLPVLQASCSNKFTCWDNIPQCFHKEYQVRWIWFEKTLVDNFNHKVFIQISLINHLACMTQAFNTSAWQIYFYLSLQESLLCHTYFYFNFSTNYLQVIVDDTYYCTLFHISWFIRP
jgi:hypothetical protein